MNFADMKPVEYVIDKSVKDLIISESNNRVPLETGGIIIGIFESSKIVLTHASVAGPQAVHTPSNFIRDGDYTQQFLDDIVYQSNTSVNYIGEWHSHPSNCGPSQKDIQAMRWIASNPNYNVATPVMGLCIKRGVSWQLRIYILQNGLLRELKEALS